MSGDNTDSGRRRFLTAATTVVGAVGVGFVLVPFISSMQPSARARAAGAPVRADISKIEPGQMIRVKWRGKPVWLVRRTEKMLEVLPTLDASLSDAADLGADWEGGFFCPCHGSKFDLAGRVYKGVPAPTNLDVPPHTYLSETELLIGEDDIEEVV
jgi:ubiquinol-cytochrome c reductase iron-sulfur subunit